MPEERNDNPSGHLARSRSRILLNVAADTDAAGTFASGARLHRLCGDERQERHYSGDGRGYYYGRDRSSATARRRRKQAKASRDSKQQQQRARRRRREETTTMKRTQKTMRPEEGEREEERDCSFDAREERKERPSPRP